MSEIEIVTAKVLLNPEPPAPNGGTVVSVVCNRAQGGRRTDFYLAGSTSSAEHLVGILKSMAV